MKIPVYNIKNEKTGEVEVSDSVFARPWNPDLVHQVLLVKAANRHRLWASTKDRGEVSGGGKKPWKQKGTGRARHGSIRSPLWKGGGVTFGPNNKRTYLKKINKKMLKAALFSVLTKKLNDGELKIIDNLQLLHSNNKGGITNKTKDIYRNLKTFEALHALLVPNKNNKLIWNACSNLPKVECQLADSLSVEKILKHRKILIDQAAVGDIKTHDSK